jgi:hypothetical protein
MYNAKVWVILSQVRVASMVAEALELSRLAWGLTKKCFASAGPVWERLRPDDGAYATHQARLCQWVSQSNWYVRETVSIVPYQ